MDVGGLTQRPTLNVDTALTRILSNNSAMSEVTIYHSALPTATFAVDGASPNSETSEGGSSQDMLMSRSDSGFSDGDIKKTTDLGEHPKTQDYASKSRRPSKPRRRPLPSPQQPTSNSTAVTDTSPRSRRSSSNLTAKESERTTTQSGQYRRRPHTSTGTSSNTSPGSSIRALSRRSTVSKNASFHRSLSYPIAPTPTATDIERALEIHKKSCQLFQSLSEKTATLTSQPPLAPALQTPLSPSTTTEANEPPPAAKTKVIHWTSHRTRRAEYAAIDAQNRGIRGFVRLITPSCLHRRLFARSGRRDFYFDPYAQRSVERDAGCGLFVWGGKGGKKKNGGDTDSVRRYRLDLPEEDDEAEKVGWDGQVGGKEEE
ncbi:MAG: Fungal specific transcription factor [Chaenotheca gracillima]|nr:MAG: Fungal specific transcription factor [Chaenotheca gracillima]